MKVLVTGATGFIGSAIARRLLHEGEEVHAYCRAAERARPLEDAGATVFLGSIGDPNAIRRAAEGCSLVIHAAAIPSFRASKTALGWVNVAGTENALAGARRAGASRFVHISCADVTLCNRTRRHWNEDRTLIVGPANHHARTKQIAEEAVVGSGDSEMATVALRPGRVWGAGDTTWLPQLCLEGLEGGIRMVSKGEILLALTHVENLVDAVLLASRREQCRGGVYHVLDTELTLARDFFADISEILGLPSPRLGPAYAGAFALARVRELFGLPGHLPTDVIERGRSTSFDCERARRDLAFEPRVGHAEGLESLRAWVSEMGGARAIAAAARPIPRDEDVSEQIELAGGK